jgi:hypothetical protein
MKFVFFIVKFVMINLYWVNYLYRLQFWLFPLTSEITDLDNYSVLAKNIFAWALKLRHRNFCTNFQFSAAPTEVFHFQMRASGHDSRLQFCGNFEVEFFSYLSVCWICQVNLCPLASYSLWLNPKSMKLKILVLFSGVNHWRCCCSLGTSYFLSVPDRFSDHGEERAE